MKKYWVLVGLLFVAGFLFAQNRANYDKSYYEPIKLKPFKTHPNASVPEEVELEPDLEPAPKANTETTKPVLTKKDDKKAVINQEVIVNQKAQEPKTDIKSESINNNSPSSEKIAADNKSQEEKIEKGEPKSPFTFLPKGKSKAFKITPVEGVTISAEENALDKDREFTMKALPEKQIDDFADKLNTERKETGCVISAWELHAGMADNEILEGSFKMEFDLEKLGVLPEFYKNVACYRIDEKGKWSDYDILINGSKASVESRQNSSVVFAVVDTIGLALDSEGNIRITNPKDAKDKGKDFISFKNEWVVKNSKYSDLKIKIHNEVLLKEFKIDLDYIKNCEDEFLKIYKLTKNSREIDNKMEEYRYNKYNKQLREQHVFEALKNKKYFIGIAENIARDYKKVIDLKDSVCSSFQKALDYYCDVIFPKGLAHPTGTVNVYFQNKIFTVTGYRDVTSAVTLTNIHSDVVGFTNPSIYLGIGLIKDNTKAKYDNLTLTVTHEFFHVIQRAKYNPFLDSKWAEATAQYFEEEAFKWFTDKDNGEILPKNLDSEGKELGLRYEYYAYPIDCYEGSIDGKVFSLSGENAANSGYPLWQFIKYVWKKEKNTDKPENWDDLLRCLKYTDNNFSSLFRYTFIDKSGKIMTLPKMTEYYTNFAKEYSDRIFSRVASHNVSNKDLLLTANNSINTNGYHVDLIDEDFTIRLRELHNEAKSDYKNKNNKPKEIAMQIVFDNDLQDTIPEMDFKPVGPDKSSKTKKGWFYHSSVLENISQVEGITKQSKNYKNELFMKGYDDNKIKEILIEKFGLKYKESLFKDFYILEIDGGSTDSSTLEVKPTGQWGSYTLEEKEVKKSGYTIWTMYAPELEEKPFDFEMVEEIVNGKKEQVEKVRLQLPKKSEAALLGKCIDGYIVKINVDKGEKIERYFEMDKIKEQKVYFDFEELKPKDFEPNEPITGKVSVAEYVLSNNDKKLEGPESEEVEFVLNNSLIIEMVKCPAGSFMMGSSVLEPRVIAVEDQEIQHKVTISKPFYIGKYEITQEQYKKVMGKNPSYFKCASAPVENIDWEEAEKFCEVLNTKYAYTIPEKGYKYALPTEAQWEYACRAGTTTALNSGKEITLDKDIQKYLEIAKSVKDTDSTQALIQLNNFKGLLENLEKLKCSNLDEVAWYKYNSKRKTHPVGQKKPNAWGIYDMHGNVGEWCADWSYKYTKDAVTDPVGKKEAINNKIYRNVRGGNFMEIAINCRSGFRAVYDLDNPFGRKGAGIGFRVVLVQTEN
ncbi:MAG: formylglycine-generating enzyme family protein [Candidatus Riflebacteria bacterium]|nr:formylglycine-generating enzyme family protein [Candidatus Riflebacteria bacterium]